MVSYNNNSSSNDLPVAYSKRKRVFKHTPNLDTILCRIIYLLEALLWNFLWLSRTKLVQRILVNSIRGRATTGHLASESADGAILRVLGVSGQSSGGSALPTRSEHERVYACQHILIRRILPR